MIAAVPHPGAGTRAALRDQIEHAIEAALDTAHRLIGLLDQMTGDPDLEPGADAEDIGEAEPALAALVGQASQIRWVGFEQGVAA